MQANFNVTLAQYKQISNYKPKIGDFVVWHGWFTHYYGIINGIDDNSVRIIKSGMPVLLFSMDAEEMENNMEIVSTNKIKKSRGAYAIQQNGIWYIYDSLFAISYIFNR